MGTWVPCVRAIEGRRERSHSLHRTRPTSTWRSSRGSEDCSTASLHNHTVRNYRNHYRFSKLNLSTARASSALRCRSLSSSRLLSLISPSQGPRRLAAPRMSQVRSMPTTPSPSYAPARRPGVRRRQSQRLSPTTAPPPGPRSRRPPKRFEVSLKPLFLAYDLLEPVDGVLPLDAQTALLSIQAFE